MYPLPSDNNRTLLFLIVEMCQAARFCRQDSAFCEGVTFSQFLILDTLADRGTVKIADLHEILAVEKSTTTRLVTPLVRRKLVEKKPSRDDRRAIHLSLTREGRDTHERVWDCFMGFADTLREKIPADERKQVYAALRKFLDAIRTASSACPCDTDFIRKKDEKNRQYNR